MNITNSSSNATHMAAAESTSAAGIDSATEIDRLKAELQNQRELVQHWKAKAILGADYEDAERYRWLRKDALNPHTRWVPRIGVSAGGGTILYRYVQTEQEFDASLDTARRATGPVAAMPEADASVTPNTPTLPVARWEDRYKKVACSYNTTFGELAEYKKMQAACEAEVLDWRAVSAGLAR